jgi:hypothetical protein
MKTLALLFFFLVTAPDLEVFNFDKNSSLKDWRIVDDVVMGGRSDGNFKINDSGHGEFSGIVSLEKNGGFSSVRYRFQTVDVSNFSKMIIRLKGDGKRYQFRLKSKQNERQSYISYFETTGKWETIEIELRSMYPTWRGMTLDMPDFQGKTIEELAFLISNNKAETFKLEIDHISLK